MNKRLHRVKKRLQNRDKMNGDLNGKYYKNFPNMQKINNYAHILKVYFNAYFCSTCRVIYWTVFRIGIS
jgi:hypothetical protein